MAASDCTANADSGFAGPENTLADDQGFALQFFCAGEIALGRQHVANKVFRRRGIGMLDAQHPLGGGEILAEQPLRFGDLAAIHQQLAKVALVGRGFAMLVAENLHANGQRIARRLFGFVEPAEIAQHHGRIR